MQKINVITLGCAKNRVDSEHIAAQLAEVGYEIVFDSEGTPLFIVNQLVGKRMSTLCRIGLYEIVNIRCESGEEQKAHKTPAGVRKYSYVPTLFSDRVCRIYTVGKHERAEILIEVSDEIAAFLSDYAREARELMQAKRDEDEY